MVFIYLLQRNSGYGSSQMIDSLHHYTQKFKDLGPIQAVQQHAQKLSESLPWYTKPESGHEVHYEDTTAPGPFADYTEEILEPYVDYTEDEVSPFLDYDEQTAESNLDYTEVDYTEDSTEPYIHYAEDSTDSSDQYAEDSTEPFLHHTGELNDPSGHHAEDSTDNYLHHTGESVAPGTHSGQDSNEPYVHHSDDTKESYIDYTEDAVSASSKTTTSSAGHSGANPGTGSSVLSLPHLKDLCRKTQWIEGLWIQCTSYCGASQTAWCGGLNNARTRFQTCLRVAIDAGAGVIIPQILLRGVGEANVNDFGQDACADDWFDLAYTEKIVSANCPQLQLRANCPDAVGRSVALATPPETDSGMIHTPHYIDGVFTTGEFRQNVVLPALSEANRINASSGGVLDGTTIVEYGDTFMGWNYHRSDEYHTIRKELFKATKFQDGMQQIGDKVRDSHQLQHGAYIAVHLRGESDWPPEWGAPDQQMALYTEEIANIRATDEGRDVTSVFVSSGEQGVIQAFRDRLQPLGYTVYDKWTLLSDFPSDLANLQAADFDAMGIVDDAVLKGAMYFMGVCKLSTPRDYPLYCSGADHSAL